jgi:hypothetical protein
VAKRRMCYPLLVLVRDALNNAASVDMQQPAQADTATRSVQLRVWLALGAKAKRNLCSEASDVILLDVRR